MGENRERNQNIPGFANFVTLAPSVFVVSFAFSFVGTFVDLYLDRMETIEVPLLVLVLVGGVLYAGTVLVLSVSFARYYKSRSDLSETNGDGKSGKSDYFVGFVAILMGVVIGSVVTAFGISLVLIPIIFGSVLFPAVQDLIMYLYIFALPLVHSVSVFVCSVALIHLCYAVGLSSKLGVE